MRWMPGGQRYIPAGSGNRFLKPFPVNLQLFRFTDQGSKLRRARLQSGSQGQILPGERAAASRLMAARECVLVAENPEGDAVCETWPADRAPRGQRRVVGLRGRGLFLPALVHARREHDPCSRQRLQDEYARAVWPSSHSSDLTPCGQRSSVARTSFPAQLCAGRCEAYQTSPSSSSLSTGPMGRIRRSAFPSTRLSISAPLSSALSWRTPCDPRRGWTPNASPCAVSPSSCRARHCPTSRAR